MNLCSPDGRLLNDAEVYLTELRPSETMFKQQAEDVDAYQVLHPEPCTLNPKLPLLSPAAIFPSLRPLSPLAPPTFTRPVWCMVRFRLSDV